VVSFVLVYLMFFLIVKLDRLFSMSSYKMFLNFSEVSYKKKDCECFFYHIVMGD
jgi:hypothetical protein